MVTLEDVSGIPVDRVSLRGVFTVADARGAGWTPSAMLHAEATGHWLRLRRGAYCVADPDPDPFTQRRSRHLAGAIAAAAVSAGAVLSHTSAAVAHGLPVLAVPVRSCLTVPLGHTHSMGGVHLHSAVVPASRLRSLSGVSVTDVARTVIDVAREGGVRAGLVVADAALAKRLTTPAELECVLAECAGWPGIRAGRRVLVLADERSESPLESISRLVLDARVPAPDLQSSIFDLSGRFLARVDMLWPAVGVVGEADGFGKYEGLQTLRSEKQRQERLEERGLIVVRWGMADLADPETLVSRVLAAHRRGARPGRVQEWTWRPAPRFPRPNHAG